MPDPIPCPECRKPIQPQASNCWFCGAVFDTNPCPRCDSAVKRGSLSCWFCGDPMPIVPRTQARPPSDAPALSENIQASPVLREEPPSPPSECTDCGEKLSPSFRYCPACGRPLHVVSRRVHWEERPSRRAHRGGTLLALAILSLLCCGIVLGPIVAVRATYDLTEMHRGEMDTAGEGMTRAAQVIALVAAVLHVAAVILRVSFQ